MLNPELVAYVRTQLDSGVSRDEITRALLGNGWTSEDVQATFAAVQPPPPVPMPPPAGPAGPNLAAPSSAPQSRVHKVLRALVYASAVVLATGFGAPFFFGGGWSGLIVAYLIGPYVTAALYVCAVSFIAYVILYFAVWQKKGYRSFGVIVLFIGVISSALAGADLVSRVQGLSAQRAADASTPIDTGTRTYDFSKDVAFHTGKVDIASFQQTALQVNGDMVLWPELTKTYPAYMHDMAEIFVFTANKATSQGTVTRLTHYDQMANDVSPIIFQGAALAGGYVLANEGYGDGPQNLVMFDPSTGAKTNLSAGDEYQHTSVMGSTGNYIVLYKTTSSSSGTATGLYLFDPATKNTTPIAQDEYGGLPYTGHGVVCYSTLDGNISVYDVASKKTTVLHTASANHLLRQYPAITACSSSFAIYSFSLENGPGTTSQVERHVVIAANGKTTDRAIAPADTFLHQWSVAIGDDLYYADASTLYRRNMVTGNETTILTVNGLAGWNTDGTSLVYAVPDPSTSGAYTLHFTALP